jgi:hypothetical protein
MCLVMLVPTPVLRVASSPAVAVVAVGFVIADHVVVAPAWREIDWERATQSKANAPSFSAQQAV